MDAFITPLTGGLMIGGAAVLLLLTLGRIAGISGIVWGAISAQPDNSWRWLFILGLIVGPLVFHGISGAPQPAASDQPWWVAMIGGLIVGVGVKLGSGCTSGHGVCGIGRLSMRSLVATITFMATGVISVYLFHHLLGALL